jgi:TolB-like protein
MNLQSFFRELKRRNIYKVATVYAIAGWLIIQICAVTFPYLNIPSWMITSIIIIVLVGFPLALIFAWAFELTPEGIKRTKEVPKQESITSLTGRRLNFWIIGLLSITLLLVLTERIWFAGSAGQYQLHTMSNKNQSEASVAVLPFDDFSPKGDQQWFSDGLTEEILNSLARLPELKVPARTSSFLFKNADLPIHIIADSLNVNHIVEGSVRRSGNNLRITAQLIRAKDGDHLWSKTYDRHADSVFSVQEDIAQKIASALDIYLDEEDREKMFAFGTRNVEAYKAYLKGRSIYDSIHNNISEDPQSFITKQPLLRKANPWFEKAINLDPKFAAPYYFHHDGYSHYIIGFPDSLVDTLSKKKAFQYMLDDLNKAITYADKPGFRTMYELEKIQYSNDWARVPELIQRLKNDPQAQRAHIMIEGGWSEALINITGHARLQYQLTQRALQLNPLDKRLKTSLWESQIQFAPTDSILSKKYTPPEPHPGQLFAYLRAGKMEKTDSLVNKIDHYASTLLFKIAKNKPIDLERELNTVPDSLKLLDIISLLYYANGNRQKANQLVARLDTTLLGPQKLIFGNPQVTGGYLSFDPDSLPTVRRMFSQAGIDVEYTQLGKATLPRVVQKE